MSSSLFDLEQIGSCLKQGGVIAYPTEAIYGIGCIPSNEKALCRVIKIKARDINKGMILIAHDFALFEKYIAMEEISSVDLTFMKQYWFKPYTFIVPAKPDVSFYLKGNHTTIAIRVTSHPLIKSICELVGEPLVSTSANKSKEEPCKTYEESLARMGNLVDLVIDGETLGYSKPSTIIDLKSKQIIRN